MMWWMVWRIGAWISFIIFVFLVAATGLVLLAPESWGFPQMSSDIDWSTLPASIALAIWYHESHAFLPLGAAALLPGVIGLFRTSNGKTAGWPLALNLIVGSIAGLLLILSATAIVAYGPISTRSMSYMLRTRSEIVAGVFFTLTVLFPTIYVCLVSTVERILSYWKTGATPEGNPDFRFVRRAFGVLLLVAIPFFGGQTWMWYVVRESQSQMVTLYDQLLIWRHLERISGSSESSSDLESAPGIHPLRDVESPHDLVDPDDVP